VAGVGDHGGVEGVADAALEGAEGLLGGLALGDLAVVVGAAWAVAVADLGDSGHVDGVVHLAVPAEGEPVDLAGTGRHLDGSGPVVRGVVVAGREEPSEAGSY